MWTSAFTSRYHWSFAGGPEQWVMSGYSMVSVRPRTSEKLRSRWLSRCVRIAQCRSLTPPTGSSPRPAEGLASAYAALGDEDARDEWISNAESLVEAIADDEDRALIASQLASIPLGSTCIT